MLLFLIITPWNPPTSLPSNYRIADPFGLATLLLVCGSFALVLGVTNLRLGFWLKEYNVRLLNIISGILALLLSALLASSIKV
jgi:uncharacterized membrane protein HdeD (DUF308 family)